jgi:hypothetical protein
MKRTKKIAIAAVALGALLLADALSLTGGHVWIDTAEAVRGRPATPMSYAGVARRTTRRAVAVGAAVTPNCVTTYNAYGQAVTACY